MALRQAQGAWNRDRPARILVCGAGADTAELLCTHCDQAGHAVEFVDTGSEALARLWDRPFQLLILDLPLPDIDGLDAVKAIRAEPDRSDLPIVVLSASNTTEDLFASYHHGADLHLRKPLKPEDLLGIL